MSKIKELLAKPESWAQGSLARNRRGEAVGPSDESACCFCLWGAVVRCYPERSQYCDVLDALHAAIEARVGKRLSLVSFNDRSETTHADILAVVERAGV